MQQGHLLAKRRPAASREPPQGWGHNSVACEGGAWMELGWALLTPLFLQVEVDARHWLALLFCAALLPQAPSLHTPTPALSHSPVVEPDLCPHILSHTVPSVPGVGKEGQVPHSEPAVPWLGAGNKVSTRVKDIVLSSLSVVQPSKRPRNKQQQYRGPHSFRLCALMFAS